jgi:hypothetical protein
MKKIFILVLVAAACSPSKKENQEQTETPMAASLTDAQKSEGWKLLFDGQTMNGWKIFKDRKNNTWEVKDGTLHCKAINEQVKGDGDERSDLMTTDEFQNFELAFDWKISPKGNSGVMFRVTEEFEQPYYSGPEYQVIDDVGYMPKPTDKQLTGANYDMNVTESKTLKPVGEWNSSKIVVNGTHVEHWLNDQKIVDYELSSDDWKTRKANSKWKDAAGYGIAPKGHIDLQDHGCEVWFKNIMIKTL